jgi:carbonic anhydrase
MEKQTPYITLISCSDSSVQTALFGYDTTNEIFVVRNIGNQLLNSLGSIDYGIYHLHTPILMVLGHVRCGAIKTALSDFSQETEEALKEVNQLFLPISKADEKNEFLEKWEDSSIINVDFQVDLAIKRYKNLIDEKELTVVGALYDFTNYYKKGKGVVLITNINGVNKKSEILKFEDIKKFKDLEDAILDR